MCLFSVPLFDNLCQALIFCFVADEERRIRDEQERIQSIRDELKDKTMRINELEVRIVDRVQG